MPETAYVPGRAGDVDATITLSTPDGHERFSRYINDGTQVVARFAEYTIPGIYRLTAPAGGDLLAVNGTRAESDFEKLQSADVQTRLQPLPVLFETEETLGQAAAGDKHGLRELSALFMMALVAVLMVENVCANRF